MLFSMTNIFVVIKSTKWFSVLRLLIIDSPATSLLDSRSHFEYPIKYIKLPVKKKDKK